MNVKTAIKNLCEIGLGAAGGALAGSYVGPLGTAGGALVGGLIITVEKVCNLVEPYFKDLRRDFSFTQWARFAPLAAPVAVASYMAVPMTLGSTLLTGGAIHLSIFALTSIAEIANRFLPRKYQPL